MIRPRPSATPVCAATEAGDVSAAVYARIGFGDHAQLDAHGDPLDGDMVHLARDTPFGWLRSRLPGQVQRAARARRGGRIWAWRCCGIAIPNSRTCRASCRPSTTASTATAKSPAALVGVKAGPGGRSMLRGFIPAFVPPAMRGNPDARQGAIALHGFYSVLRPAGRQHPFPALVVRRARPGQRLHRPDRRHRAAAQDPVHSCRRPRRRPDRPRAR